MVPALSDVPSTEELTRMFRGDKHSTFLGAIVDSIGLKGQESLGRTGTLATRIDHVLARFLERLSLGQHIPMPRIVEVQSHHRRCDCAAFLVRGAHYPSHRGECHQ